MYCMASKKKNTRNSTKHHIPMLSNVSEQYPSRAIWLTLSQCQFDHVTVVSKCVVHVSVSNTCQTHAWLVSRDQSHVCAT
jgi:hypothetical protein